MSPLATRLRGAAALAEMLDMIGQPDNWDTKLARVFTEHELALRSLLEFVLVETANGT